MAIIFAIAIACSSIGLSALIAFAGGMRTSGSTDSDTNAAMIVLVCGLGAAFLVALTHWLGW